MLNFGFPNVPFMKRLEELFLSYTGVKASEVTELTSSGSNRRYFRLRGKDISLVGVVGTNLEENKAFIAIDRHFLSKAIRVPRVLAVSGDGMCYIQEDLGNDQLYTLVRRPRERGVQLLRACASVQDHRAAAEDPVPRRRGSGL